MTKVQAIIERGNAYLEVERLKSELAQAKAELEDWKTDYIGMCNALAAGEIERLKAELAQANARQHQSDLNYAALEKQNARLQGRIDAQAQAICLASDKLMEAKAENERLTGELEGHAWKVSPAMAQAKIDQLQAENFKLRGELGSVRSGSGKVAKFLRGEIRELKAKLAEIEYLDSEAQHGADEVTRQLQEAKAHMDHYRLKLLAVRQAIGCPDNEATAEYCGKLKSELAQAKAENERLRQQITREKVKP